MRKDEAIFLKGTRVIWVGLSCKTIVCLRGAPSPAAGWHPDRALESGKTMAFGDRGTVHTLALILYL